MLLVICPVCMAGSIGPVAATEQDVFVPKLHQITLTIATRRCDTSRTMSVRRFRPRSRVALFLAARGRCASCGAALQPGWHGDHVTPFSAGGRTVPANGQALCPRCNREKGVRSA